MLAPTGNEGICAGRGPGGWAGPLGAWREGCCWAEESESLSLSWGLEMLGEVLRLSWSMSLGSLLPSSFTLRLSELSPSPSEGELGRLISWEEGRGKREGHAGRPDPPEGCPAGGGEPPQATGVSEHLTDFHQTRSPLESGSVKHNPPTHAGALSKTTMGRI